MKRIYVAGPMRGLPEFNFPAFIRAANDLARVGWDVVNPATLDLDAGFRPEDALPESFDMRAVCLRDVQGLLTCDAIYMLRGWADSKGATAERAIALWLGLEVLGAAA